MNINESIIYDMPTAYILVFCEPGCETAVVDELRTLPSVVEAARIYGSSYDIIVKVTSDTTSKLTEIISKNIRRVEKVKATQTMTVIEKDKVN
ncbi:MAG TPA: Lrp/AsnC ligand binding domain-containing protein [Nitrososphaeraceae archaeon]